MFTVHCPGHRARVLLGPRSIDALVTTEEGIAVHWRCRCGSHGVLHEGRAAARASHPASRDQAA